MLSVKRLALLIASISLWGCNEASPLIDLCVLVTRVDSNSVEPYLQCADSNGRAYELPADGAAVDRYRCVSPVDFERLEQFYRDQCDKRVSK